MENQNHSSHGGQHASHPTHHGSANKSASLFTDGNKMTFFMGFFSGLAVISVIGFFVLLGLLFSGKDAINLGAQAGDNAIVDAGAAAPLPPAEPAGAPVAPITDEDNYSGDLDAPVQLIVYDDFECPFCLRHAETVKQIQEEYGDKVAVAIRHFPLSFHPSAQKAAEASECAADQGKFWEMHDALFAAQEAGNMSVAQFKADAKKLGLKTSKFNDCLDDGDHAGTVSTQIAEGSSFGVTGTPGNFLNGQKISGAVPFETFKAAIDAAL